MLIKVVTQKLLLLSLSLVCIIGSIQGQENTETTEPSTSTETAAPKTTNYKWQTPAGIYTDPSSFFSLHGYVNGVYAGKSPHWTNSDPTQLGKPAQLLVPKTDKSAFQFDAALVISSEITQKTRVLIETHFVSDPSNSGAAGPGGLTIAMTEATASYDLASEYLTVSAGLFWVPFGIVNTDWLGAQNLFGLIPRASGVIPVHYNEKGVRLNGAISISRKIGINYVVSLGNGVENMNISGQSSFDKNDDKTFAGRIGVFPGLGDKLSIGLSYLRGQLSATGDSSLGATNVLRYPSTIRASGVDVTFIMDNFKLRGYGIISTQDLLTSGGLTGASEDLSIDRQGAAIEASYTITISKKLPTLIPKVRFDWVNIGSLGTNGSGDVAVATYTTYVTSFGLNIGINQFVYFSFDYNIAREHKGQAEHDNDRFLAKMTAQF